MPDAFPTTMACSMISIKPSAASAWASLAVVTTVRVQSRVTYFPEPQRNRRIRKETTDGRIKYRRTLRGRRDTKRHDRSSGHEAVPLVRRSGPEATSDGALRDPTAERSSGNDGCQWVRLTASDVSPSSLSDHLCTAKKYSQRRRPWPTSADALSTIPTPADYNRPLARNSKTEGRGFESFRPCHFSSLVCALGYCPMWRRFLIEGTAEIRRGGRP